jgi:hypothetical protein
VQKARNLYGHPGNFQKQNSCARDDNEQEGRSMIRNALLKMRPVLPTKVLRLLRLPTMHPCEKIVHVYKYVCTHNVQVCRYETVRGHKIIIIRAHHYT